eukprot:m.91149 g.91149  ORF g.91149 m.91149 type:complete len:258 (+) comp13724_c0_seq3:702-1475(+)
MNRAAAAHKGPAPGGPSVPAQSQIQGEAGGVAQQYAAAIARMLAEIDALTKENAQLAAEAKQEMKQMQPPQELTTRELLDLDIEVLRERTAAAVQRKRFMEERNEELLSRIQTLQNELIKHNEVESKIISLAKASAAQAAVQKALEAQLLSAAVLKATCKRNESAILQLEKMLEVQARRGTAAPTVCIYAVRVCVCACMFVSCQRSSSLRLTADDARDMSQARSTRCCKKRSRPCNQHCKQPMRRETWVRSTSCRPG